MISKNYISNSKSVIISICAVLILLTVPFKSSVSANTTGELLLSDSNYYSYYSSLKDTIRPESVTKIIGSEFASAENPQKAVAKLLNVQGGAISSDNKWIQWNFNIETAGAFSIYIDYSAYENQFADLGFSIEIDGKQPYTEAKNLTLPLVWVDDASENGSSIKRDFNGNDLRPNQISISRWITRGISDILGHYNEPYLFNLSKGEHTLRISKNKGNMVIGEIRFQNISSPKSYAKYKSNIPQESDKAVLFVKEAENTLFKTSSMLFPTSDESNVATNPSSSSKIRMNTIGQNNWNLPRQLLAWEISVENPGWYNISFRARQITNQGLFSYRNFYIDNEIPFEQAQNMEFKFDLNWYMKTLGEEQTPVYLTKGRHTVSMEATCGEMSGVLSKLNNIIKDLNETYRKIIIVTGTSPDIYRDYQLEKEIPGLYDMIKNSIKKLEIISNDIKAITQSASNITSIISQDIEFFNDLLEKPYTIAERIPTFAGNVEGLGSLYLSLSSQPLELDSISFVPVKDKIPAANAGFIRNLAYSFEKFVSSFIYDYNNIGSLKSGKKSVNVWVSTGRDQAQVILGLVNDLYAPTSPIDVKLQVVDTSNTLIMATLAGKGPDIALLMPKEAPVNLAMRGALVDLNKFGVNKIFHNFYKSALIPYEYQGGMYAIPESQTFDMLFYRTDVFKQLNIKLPQTWEEFYSVVEKLQANNLNVGIQEMDRNNLAVSLAISTFDKFYFQDGGTYYNDNLSKTNFNDTKAYNAFDKVVKLYTDFGLDREFDFYNRFRSGEMAMSIQNYSMYNLLVQLAPEITGLWDFAPIPGTKKPDGSINRAESSAGTACILMKSAEKKNIAKEAYDFMVWWTNSTTQGKYGTEIESIMGPTARYNPANKDAFASIPWNDKDASLIKEQWESVVDIQQIPGNYYISRSLTSAIRISIKDKVNLRRNFTVYNNAINNEIARKRSEFGLDK